ncbi:MAG: hypothetical protein ACTHZ9_13075 [Leucobacter sp.]
MTAIAAAGERRTFPPVLAAALIGVVMVTGCTQAPATEPAPTEAEQEVAAEEEAAPAGLEETDFGNLAWVFRPGGNVPETEQVELVDGTASGEMVSYELGEVVLVELSGDDRIDAAVQITRLDGNALDEQWYLWIATDDGPVQSTLPVARMAPCGNVTHSVTAVEGGIEIHESRRSVADQALPCSEAGTDERTRTVSALEARNIGEWWPVQTAPIGGFGGLCPMTTHMDTYANDAALFAVPDLEASEPIAFDGASEVFEIEAWPVYGEPFPGWVLAGVQHGSDQGCAWAERP